MHLYITFISSLLGLVLASFFNALLYRIDKEYKYPDIFIKNSHCEQCGKQLVWYELIPILSYIIFKGKCRKCGYSIPLYYPLSELFLGIGFGSIYYYSLPWYYYITLLFLFSLSYYDRIYKGIPKTLTHIFLGYSVLIALIMSLLKGMVIDNSILVSLGLTSILFLIGKVMMKPFGFGDILILLGLGFVMGMYQYIAFVYIFFFISALYSIVMILMRKIKRESKIPLLPFIYFSFVITMLLGDWAVYLIELFVR